MNTKKELKRNLEDFIEMLGLEQKKKGDIVKRDKEVFYHYLGSEYKKDSLVKQGLEKEINYFSSHNIPKQSDGLTPPFEYAEYGYDFSVTITEKSDD
tara:strand:+ start:110 stop:400 length:291 start_codon:yes stop_codon:yes gene_type:complete